MSAATHSRRSRLGRGLVLEMLIGFLLAACVTGAIANAHSIAGRYTVQWWPSVGPVYWVFHQNAGPTFRDAVRRGAADWNAIGEPLQFTQLANDATTTPSCHQSVLPWNWGNVYMQNIDGAHGTLGQAQACAEDPFNPTRMTSFRMWYDPAENFYRGTGQPGANQYDLWGLATHEFGHATGWVGPPDEHFQNSSPECQNAPRHTMCPRTDLGDTFWRTPTTHDIHTFQAAY